MVEFIDVGKTFDEKIALEKINVTINDGEIAGQLLMNYM